MSSVAHSAPPSANAEAVPMFYAAGSYQPEDSVAYLMRRIMSLFIQAVDRELAPTGLTHAQWVPLFRLYRGDAKSVAELARLVELDTGAMTRLLDRLQAKGLCQRLRSASDRRVVEIELTPAGIAAAQQIPALLSDTQNRLLKGFSPDEWQLATALLQRMLANAHNLNTSHETPSA